MRALITVLILLGAMASQPAVADSRFGLRMAQQDFAPRAPKHMLPQRSGPRVDTQEAAARVKQAFRNYKILSLHLIDSASGPPVYRAKTLSPDGVIKYVYIDGQSGDVFE